jgi:signal transduction histidine kinase
MGIELLQEDLLRLPEAESFQESFRSTVQRIDQEITAANKIVQDLLEYARNMKFEYTETDVNSLIDGVLFNLAEKITQYRISVNTNYEDIGTIIADGIRIRQVMLNIIQNSIEAMEQGGTLTITTTSQDESTVVISVQDTGCGITPEHRQRIFEPFFTTKEQGVGLGMSIVHKIVEAHGGTIDIESEEGEGTTFTVILPRRI